MRSSGAFPPVSRPSGSFARFERDGTPPGIGVSDLVGDIVYAYSEFFENVVSESSVNRVANHWLERCETDCPRGCDRTFMSPRAKQAAPLNNNDICGSSISALRVRGALNCTPSAFVRLRFIKQYPEIAVEVKQSGSEPLTLLARESGY